MCYLRECNFKMSVKSSASSLKALRSSHLCYAVLELLSGKCLGETRCKSGSGDPEQQLSSGSASKGISEKGDTKVPFYLNSPPCKEQSSCCS